MFGLFKKKDSKSHANLHNERSVIDHTESLRSQNTHDDSSSVDSFEDILELVFEYVLADESENGGRALFKEFLKQSFNEENIEFYTDVQELKKLYHLRRPVTNHKKVSVAKSIFRKYLAVGSEKLLNISPELRTHVEDVINKSAENSAVDLPENVFHEIEEHVVELLKFNGFANFIHTEAYITWRKGVSIEHADSKLLRKLESLGSFGSTTSTSKRSSSLSKRKNSGGSSSSMHHKASLRDMCRKECCHNQHMQNGVLYPTCQFCVGALEYGEKTANMFRHVDSTHHASSVEHKKDEGHSQAKEEKVEECLKGKLRPGEVCPRKCCHADHIKEGVISGKCSYCVASLIGKHVGGS